MIVSFITRDALSHDGLHVVNVFVLGRLFLLFCMRAWEVDCFCR